MYIRFIRKAFRFGGGGIVVFQGFINRLGFLKKLEVVQSGLSAVPFPPGVNSYRYSRYLAIVPIFGKNGENEKIIWRKKKKENPIMWILC